MKSGIKTKALIFLVAVPVVLIVSLSVMLFTVEFNKDLRNAKAMLETKSNNIRDALYLEISRSFELLRTVATNPVTGRVISRMGRIPDGLDNDDYQVLEEFKDLKDVLDYTARNTTVDLVYVASQAATGIIVGRDVQIGAGFDVRKRDYYAGAMAKPGLPFISEPRVSAEQSVEPIIVITAAQTVADSGGKIVGLAAFNYRLTPIIALIKAQMENYGVDISLYDTTGQYVLWHKFADREYFYDPKNTVPLTTLLEGLGYTGAEGTALAETLTSGDGHYFDAASERGDLMVQSVRVPGTRWALLVQFPRSQVVSELLSSIVPPLLLFLVVFLAAQLIIFIVTLQGVVKPLVRVGKNLEALAAADADLTVTIPRMTDDEIGQVAQSFNHFTGKLRVLMIEVKKAIENTNNVKQNVSASTEETSSAIEEISANLNSIGKQVETLDGSITDNMSTIRQITTNISQVDDQIVSQSAMVEESTAAITEMIASLNNVNSIAQAKQKTTLALAKLATEGKDKIDETANTFKLVVSHINQIQEMASTINNIAAQTNLLSMNAAIEAAHAGDSGRGFAVVAEEIRKLADSAAKSSRTIAQLIKDISIAVRDTDQNVSRTSQAFERINQEVTSTVNAFTEIEQSVSELNIGGQQILESTNQINEVTVHIRDGSREIKSGTRAMLDSSSKIKEVSDRVTTGMAEATMGTSEIVRSMQLMVQQAQELNSIVDDLRFKFGQFKTE